MKPTPKNKTAIRVIKKCERESSRQQKTGGVSSVDEPVTATAETTIKSWLKEFQRRGELKKRKKTRLPSP
jgi:hypothetical protein